MRFGPKCEKGFLPIFSVNTDQEALDLLIVACPRNLNGAFIAPELVEEQTLENLYAFGDRLRALYAKTCKKESTVSMKPRVDKMTITCSTKKPYRRPEPGDRKTVKGVEYVRQRETIGGMGVVRNGKPAYEWVKVKK